MDVSLGSVFFAVCVCVCVWQTGRGEKNGELGEGQGKKIERRETLASEWGEAAN